MARRKTTVIHPDKYLRFNPDDWAGATVGDKEEAFRREALDYWRDHSHPDGLRALIGVFRHARRLRLDVERVAELVAEQATDESLDAELGRILGRSHDA